MNKILFILLFLIGSSTFGQNIIFKLPFDGTDADSSGNAFSGGHTGVNPMTYSTSVKYEGSHSWIGNEYSNWESASAYNFTDRTFSFSCWMRRFNLYGGSHMIFTNKENSGSAGFDIRWDETNQRIYGRTYDGVTPNDFYTANNVMAYDQWYHLVINFYSGYVTLYLNDVKIPMADSTILTNWTDNKILAISSGSDGIAQNWLGGYLDNVHLYDGPITALQVDSLYDNGTSNFQLGQAEVPIIANGYFYRNETPKFPYRNDVKVIPIRSSGASIFIPSFSYGYDSTYILAVKQKYAIPENVSNGDAVGYWLKCWTWMGVSSSYSITTNFNNAFSINSATGLISISDYTKINGKIVRQDTTINLIIQTTSAGTVELDTAMIYVKENSYCRFIDYSYSSSESGTRTQPYNNLTDVTFQPGYGYFLKRGVVINGAVTEIKAHLASATHPTLIGVYSSGADPVFDGTTAPSNSQGWYFGDEANWITGRCEYIYVFNLDMKDYTVSAIEAYSESRYMGFYNLKIHNNDINSRQSQFVVSTNSYEDSVNYDPFEFIDCEFDTVGRLTVFEPSHLKIGTSPAYVINCRFGKSTLAALRFADGTHGGFAKHCAFNMGFNSTAETAYNIQVRDHHTVIEDCRFIGGGCGVYMTSASGVYYMHPDYVTIKNCYLYNQGGYGIYMRPPNDSYNNSVGHVYEDNLILTNGIGIKIRDAKDLIIRQNIIRSINGTGIYGILFADEADFNTKISYNIIYGFSTGIFNPIGLGLDIYNNTIDGSINVYVSNSPIVRNNFYTSSTVNTSNNIDIDNISTAQYFENYVGHNYTLKSTATLAIDRGYSYGSTIDLIGTSVPLGFATDIGALEYTLY